MLSAEDNELLTRTGPGTPMGNFFRRFWMPVLLSQELPAPSRTSAGSPSRTPASKVPFADVMIERFGDPIGRVPSLRAVRGD